MKLIFQSQRTHRLLVLVLLLSLKCTIKTSPLKELEKNLWKQIFKPHRQDSPRIILSRCSVFVFLSHLLELPCVTGL